MPTVCRDGAFAHEAEVGLDATRLIDRAGADRSARTVVEAPADDQNVKAIAADERRGDRGRVGDDGQRLPLRQRPCDRKIGRSRVDKHGVAAGYDGDRGSRQGRSRGPAPPLHARSGSWMLARPIRRRRRSACTNQRWRGRASRGESCPRSYQTRATGPQRRRGRLPRDAGEWPGAALREEWNSPMRISPSHNSA